MLSQAFTKPEPMKKTGNTAVDKITDMQEREAKRNGTFKPEETKEELLIEAEKEVEGTEDPEETKEEEKA